MERREFTGLFMALAGGALLPSIPAKATEESFNLDAADLPASLPANLKQMVRNVLKQEYKAVNTDWDGSIQIEGLLRFARRGFTEGLTYANNWFNYHVEHDAKLNDEQYFAQYDGPRARILRDGPLTFVIYSANLGVAFPVHELYKQTGSKTARQVCLDVADAVLHYAGRDRFGMLAHDDYDYQKFAIPDTAYWATRSNAIAATLTKGDLANVYWKQAIYQLDQGVKYFFDESKSISRTGLFNGDPSKTYWCRSQGWLIWAIAGLLRYLPSTHPYYKTATKSMKALADGVKKYQSKTGGLHVHVDNPSTPEEVTSISMVIAMLKEGMRKRWIPKQYDEVCEKGWAFIQKSVDAEGKVHNAYTGWAVTAEEGKTDLMDKNFRGFVPGILMLAADEMTR